MQNFVSAIRTQLHDFIEQRSDLVLVLQGDTSGMAISVNLLREFEQTPGTDLFLIVSGPFTDASSTADALANQIETERMLANQALEEDDSPALTEVPAEVLNQEADPIERIQQAIQYVASLIPEGGNHRLVVGLFPSTISDPAQYQALIKQLSPAAGIQTWMRGVRLVWCDHANLDPETYEGQTGIRVATYDMSHESIQQSLYDDVEDESLPDEQRVAAVYQLAIFDQAYDRKDDALEKLEYLLGYFQQTENEVMQALVMNTTGDVYRKAGDLESARHWYECATVPATNAKSQQALQAIVRSLAELEHQAGNEPKSQVYYSQLNELSSRNGDILSTLHSERQQAASYTVAGQHQAAAATLEQSAHKCRMLGLELELEQTLHQMVPVYDQLDATERKTAIQQELEALRTG